MKSLVKIILLKMCFGSTHKLYPKNTTITKSVMNIIIFMAMIQLTSLDKLFAFRMIENGEYNQVAIENHF